MFGASVCQYRLCRKEMWKEAYAVRAGRGRSEGAGTQLCRRFNSPLFHVDAYNL